MPATFDPELHRRVGAAIGTDMAEVGVHQGLAPSQTCSATAAGAAANAALGRLVGIAGLSITEKERRYLKDLSETRNALIRSTGKGTRF
jgi:hypothetical protein